MVSPFAIAVRVGAEPPGQLIVSVVRVWEENGNGR
jgi:hypothetical protein